MQLTLYVPGLLLPDAVLNDTVFDLAAPALSLLLGRGQRVETDPDWLARAFGVAAPLPVAALRKVGAGGTAEDTWLCLDPVHWEVEREGISLADPARLGLDAGEADALLAAIAPLFADWGELSASAPEHWELRLARSLLLETQPLPECVGLRVDPALPGGLDGAEWRRLLAEAQTLLHAHKINRQREQLGKPAVNSLWPWGQGALPEGARSDFSAVWSDDPVLAGLAALAGIPCIAPPIRYQPASGHVLCRLERLTASARALDALIWREALLALERDWLAPAVAALKKGECQALRVIGTAAHGAPRTVLFSLVRGNLWRFWRRPLPLAALSGTA
jgi:hypothetical protein